MTTRRQFVKSAGAAGLVLYGSGFGMPGRAAAAPNDLRLIDPALQPKFHRAVPNALDPSFVYRSPTNRFKVAMTERVQKTGLVDPRNGRALSTTVWGYGSNGPGGTWPGMTFEVQRGEPIEVMWQNKLPKRHLLPVDETFHWAYGLHGYEDATIAVNGPPTVPHLHGGHNDSAFDGNPEFFFSPGHAIKGPQWAAKKFVYGNDQPAATLWYHDHALGITRLNVYAGLAGFYILRDEYDTGRSDNPLGLPAFPYEAALAIQDRMFTEDGSLFYPAFPGEPFYDDFITDEGVELPSDEFPDGGPTGLAEFFGDHLMVNGTIWPKMDVEPRNYRLRFLNGCDSRFLAAQFYEVPAGATDLTTVLGGPLPYTVIGGDQGLASSPTGIDTLLIETGARYDVIFDFKTVRPGNRVIMKNIAGDDPFGGDIPGVQAFSETDRIMAFDVTLPLNTAVPDRTPSGINFGPTVGTPHRRRKVALFEGKDEFGRLQPMLGTAEPAADHLGNPINWPNTSTYLDAGLVGPIEGTVAWHSPTTENPALGSTEEWEIWNATGDAHPIHLHLVHFAVLGRREIVWDSATNDDDRVLDPTGGAAPPPVGDGTYLLTQPVIQHNDLVGHGFKLANLTEGAVVAPAPEYVENTPKDLVTALPGQITRIKATFDKPGRYVWHCHILSHEDHDMMRVLHVGAGA